MKNVIIIGAGGHGKVIADIVIRNHDTLLGFLDDCQTAPVMEYPILGRVRDWEQYRSCACFIFGIGNNMVRERLSKEISAPWYTAIHPSAQIGMDVHIGDGSSVMAGALINAETHIGHHCIVNTGAIIEHDNVLEDFVHVSPNATLCGTVRIGHGTHVGAGSVIKNNCTVCSDCILGAGSVVVRNITEQGTYIGVPARKISGG